MCITIAQEESHVWHVAACNVPGAALETRLMTFFFLGVNPLADSCCNVSCEDCGSASQRLDTRHFFAGSFTGRMRNLLEAVRNETIAPMGSQPLSASRDIWTIYVEFFLTRCKRVCPRAARRTARTEQNPSCKCNGRAKESTNAS